MTNQPILHPSTKAQADIFINSQRLNSIGIYGQKGAGKSFFAKYLAEKILDIKLGENSAYVQSIDCSKGVGIEEIRQIKTFLQLKVPSASKYSRCVIVEQIDHLGLPAQNALLKTLEEPPEGTVLIVTTSNKNLILPTIVSRLQWINLLPIAKAQLSDNFFKSFDPRTIDKFYTLSDGNLGAMLGLMENSEEYAGWLAAVEEAKFILKASRFEKLAKIDSILKNTDYDLYELLKALAKILRSILAQDHSAEGNKAVVEKLQWTVEAREALKFNPSQKLLLTSLFNKL